MSILRAPEASKARTRVSGGLVSLSVQAAPRWRRRAAGRTRTSSCHWRAGPPPVRMCAGGWPRDPRGADSAAAAEGTAMRGLDRGERARNARVASTASTRYFPDRPPSRAIRCRLVRGRQPTSRSRSCRFNVVTSAATSDEPFRSGPHQRRHPGKAGLPGRSSRRCPSTSTRRPSLPARHWQRLQRDAARSTRQLVQPGQRRSRISAEGHDNPTRNAPQSLTAGLDGGPDSDKRRRLRDAPAF